jgi:phospholipid/cholesterol/gamma-HCH transport system substrate-binding protein
VVVLVVAFATALLFIQRMRSREVIDFVTYTTENVSGLDVSSPVRYRGVPIGRVTEVRVDPRIGSVEIDFQVFLDRLLNVGMNVKLIKSSAEARILKNLDLRAQVVSNPVTGEAYLLVERPKNPPPPIPLPFTPDRPYIPSMPTMFSTMQSRLPELIERAEGTLQTLRGIITRIPDSLDRSDRFFTNIERIFEKSELPTFSADSREFFRKTGAQIEQASTQIQQITSQFDKLIGTEGTLVKFSEEVRASIKESDLPGTTQSARDALSQTNLAAEDLRRSLPAIRDSLAQLRELGRQLSEQPESVVYGTRPPKGKR